MSGVVRLRPRAAPVVATPAPNITALAKEHGVSRQTIRRRLRNGWDPAIKIIEQSQPLATPGQVVGHPPGRDAVQRVPVDLVQLRREIWEWVENHHAINRLPAIERRQHIRDRIAQLLFLVLGVAAFVGLAYAAVN